MCNRRGEDSRQTCYDIQLCTLIQSWKTLRFKWRRQDKKSSHYREGWGKQFRRHECLNGVAPPYLTDLLQTYTLSTVGLWGLLIRSSFSYLHTLLDRVFISPKPLKLKIPSKRPACVWGGFNFGSDQPHRTQDTKSTESRLVSTINLHLTGWLTQLPNNCTVRDWRQMSIDDNNKCPTLCFVFLCEISNKAGAK